MLGTASMHQNLLTYLGYITLHYITLHYRHFKRHLHLKWPVVHQQLHVIRNTAHRPSTQASYTASRVRPKRKISCAAAQIAATLTISFPRWRHMSLTSYWGQQRMSLTSYPGHFWVDNALTCFTLRVLLFLHDWDQRKVGFDSGDSHRSIKAVAFTYYMNNCIDCAGFLWQGVQFNYMESSPLYYI